MPDKSQFDENVPSDRSTALRKSYDPERSYPLLIFANTVNELMTTVPGPTHAVALTSVTPRKIWLAKDGDLLVTPRPIDDEFANYACRLTQTHAHSIARLSPAGTEMELLSDRVRRGLALEQIMQWLDTNPTACVQAFAQDRPTVDLLQQVSARHEHYDLLPDAETMDLIYRLNTKSGFRDIANGLGLRIVSGYTCNGTPELAQHASAIIAQYGRCIVKFDRSSNGYGNFVLDGRDQHDLLAAIQRQISLWPEQPERFVIEQYISWAAAPSVEILVEEGGVRLLYICDQRCVNNAWTGMITPPQDLKSETIAELESIGARFGQFVWDCGYRGPCDVDCLIGADGEVYVTESNFRRTGGTYLDTLVRRLAGRDYLRDRVWIADARPGGKPGSFLDAVDVLREKCLEFSEKSRTGTVLTADTRDIDSKWRYLIIGTDAAHCKEVEARLAEILGF